MATPVGVADPVGVAKAAASETLERRRFAREVSEAHNAKLLMSRKPAHPVVEKIACALRRVPVKRGELVLLGLSGGPDSVALFHALLALRERLGLRLAAAHLNHGLRGAESARDEAFVRRLCAGAGVALEVGEAGGLRPGLSNLEERAREVRGAFLARVARRQGAAHIALAHHGGDQAETVLLRLLRGAGARGLGAMAPVGPGKLIRPMLGLRRDQIAAYLNAIGARFITDSSNFSTALSRNRVRHQLLPMLEREYAPRLGRRLAELAGEMRALDDLVGALAERELRSALDSAGAFDLTRLAELHPALVDAVLRSFIAHAAGSLRRIGRVHVDALRRLCLKGPPNGRCDLPGGWRAVRQYRRLSLRRRRSGELHPPFRATLPGKGTTVVAAAGMAFKAALMAPRDAAMPADHWQALFDADQVGRSLVVRNFRPGDRIRPLGAAGSRKVKEVFIEARVPAERRRSFPVVVLGDRVAWLPGLKRGEVGLITPTTRRVLRVTARRLDGGDEAAVANKQTAMVPFQV